MAESEGGGGEGLENGSIALLVAPVVSFDKGAEIVLIQKLLANDYRDVLIVDDMCELG